MTFQIFQWGQKGQDYFQSIPRSNLDRESQLRFQLSKQNASQSAGTSSNSGQTGSQYEYKVQLTSPIGKA